MDTAAAPPKTTGPVLTTVPAPVAAWMPGTPGAAL